MRHFEQFRGNEIFIGTCTLRTPASTPATGPWTEPATTGGTRSGAHHSHPSGDRRDPFPPLEFLSGGTAPSPLGPLTYARPRSS